ncbi:MAG: ComEA family DNA-binding protein, partial [Acidobacteria bacterium]|nr:ComEA family DNA-binding protein [Acidobacteriota bacterium]
TAGSQGDVVVHVVGAVVNPGVFSLPAHSRVFQAIERAGGASPEAMLSNINMAAELVDGSQIVVPTASDSSTIAQSPLATSGSGAAGSPGMPAAPTTEKKVNINTATAEELASLPSVGPVLAQKIINWRGAHGGFSTTDQLDAVDGIGPKLLAILVPLVTV